VAFAHFAEADAWAEKGATVSVQHALSPSGGLATSPRSLVQARHSLPAAATLFSLPRNPSA
jgi:hypothetical protein